MNKRIKQHMPVFNVGTASMIVILTGLCFAILSALALSSARNDYRLSEKQAEHTKEYYEANNSAVETLAKADHTDAAQEFKFSVPAGDSQSLNVEAIWEDGKYTINKWQIINTSSWDVDNTLPVMKRDE